MCSIRSSKFRNIIYRCGPAQDLNGKQFAIKVSPNTVGSLRYEEDLAIKGMHCSKVSIGITHRSLAHGNHVVKNWSAIYLEIILGARPIRTLIAIGIH